MLSKYVALLVYLLVGFSESAFVDSLSKCSLKDEECIKNLIQKVIVDYSQSGVPEYEVPSFDPIKLKDVKISLLGLLNITVVDADGVGIKDCIINSYTHNIENGFTEVEVTCDIMIKGKFLVIGSNPIAGSLFGNKPIHGDSDGEIKFEKLHVGLKFFYDLVKKDDGEIYFSFRFNDTQSIYDMQNFHATFDKLFIGEEDVSEKLVTYLNENWKFLLDTFGRTVFEVALDVVYGMLNKLWDAIPASKLILDDLTPYVKNK